MRWPNPESAGKVCERAEWDLKSAKGKMMGNLWVRLKSETSRFWKETEGQDLVEYALIVAAIALGMIAAIQGVAAALNSLYQSISAALTLTS